MSDLDFGPQPSFHDLVRKEEKSPRRRLLRWFLGGIAVLVCLSGLIALLVIALGINPFLGEGLGKQLVIGPSRTLYYTSEVTQDEAVKLGGFCMANLATEHGYDVHVTRTDGVLIVSFFLQAPDWNNQENIAYYRQLRKTIAEQVFDGQALHIHLCHRSIGSAGGEVSFAVKRVID
jgi:hypothetical protein